MFSAKRKTRATLQALALVGVGMGLTDSASAQSNRYTCLNDSGDRAIVACTALLKENTNDAEAYVSRGSEYARKGEQDRAIVDYNFAIRANPEYALAYYNRGLARETKGELGPALTDYQKAVELAPADFDAKRAVARLSGSGVRPAATSSSSSGSGGPKSLFGTFFSRTPNSNNDEPLTTQSATGGGASSSSSSSWSTSRFEALERLGKLRSSGVLTKEEFEREKARILKE